MINNKRLLTIFVAVVLVTIPLVFFIHKDAERCNEHVILEDGEEFDCKNVTSYSNGMSFIRMCSGEELTISTHRIREIRKID